MGVITTLTVGFETLNRRLWLLLFPVGLNLLLWCGPRVSIAPLVRQVAARWITSPLARAYNQTQIVLLRQWLEGIAQSANLLDWLVLVAPSQDVAGRLCAYLFTNVLVMPVLAVPNDPRTAPAPAQLPTIELNEWGMLVVAAAAIWLGGVLLSALFLSLIVRIVCPDELEQTAWLRQVGASGGRIAGYLLLGAALLALWAAPLLAWAGPLLLTLPPPGAWLAIMPCLWAGIYLFFTPGAMLVSQVNPARAAWYSIQIVRMDPWQAVGLIGSMTVIQMGLPLLWQQITAWSGGLLIAMIGHAYVGTGLTVAYMIFYRDRYRQWRELVMAAGPR